MSESKRTVGDIRAELERFAAEDPEAFRQALDDMGWTRPADSTVEMCPCGFFAGVQHDCEALAAEMLFDTSAASKGVCLRAVLATEATDSALRTDPRVLADLGLPMPVEVHVGPSMPGPMLQHGTTSAGISGAPAHTVVTDDLLPQPTPTAMLGEALEHIAKARRIVASLDSCAVTPQMAADLGGANLKGLEMGQYVERAKREAEAREGTT